MSSVSVPACPRAAPSLSVSTDRPFVPLTDRRRRAADDDGATDVVADAEDDVGADVSADVGANVVAEVGGEDDTEGGEVETDDADARHAVAEHVEDVDIACDDDGGDDDAQ